MRQTAGILGVPIDRLDMAGVLERLEEFIQQRTFHQVATANTDFLVNAMADPELRHILRQSDLVIPDGMPLVWASRLMGAPLPERVTGADLVPKLAALSAQHGYRIFLLGARPEVARRTKARLEDDFPGVRIVGCVSPRPAPIVEMENDLLLESIACAQPDILMVAFGNPKQEKWIHLHRDRLRDVPVCIGVGGTFDFIAGESRRAPAFVQQVGLEWLFRLSQDPARLWRRYARDIGWGGVQMLREWRLLRNAQHLPEGEVLSVPVGDCTVISLVGRIAGSASGQFTTAAEQALRAGTHLALDLSSATGLDGEALGTLILLPALAARQGQESRLLSIAPNLTPLVRHSHLDDDLYRIGQPAAHVFAGQTAVFRLQTFCGQTSAALIVQGVPNERELPELARICRNLLEGGKRVDLDTSKVSYVDTAFLAMLSGLLRDFSSFAGSHADSLRLIPGRVLLAALNRERMTDRFVIAGTAEIAANAIEREDLCLPQTGQGADVCSTPIRMVGAR